MSQWHNIIEWIARVMHKLPWWFMAAILLIWFVACVVACLRRES